MMNNMDNGGFDLDRERDAATERMMARIGQMSNDLRTAAAQRNNGGGGGPTSMDILSHYSNQDRQDRDEFRAIEQRARDHQYQYQDRATFDAALELYNRTRCVPSMNPSSMGYIADKLWIRKEVKGQHRKPCSDCDIDFTRGMDYVQECGKGPYGADKLCVGCMGRRLKDEVGTNLSTIQQALIPLQQAQSGGIMGGSFCQMFRQDNYRR